MPDPVSAPTPAAFKPRSHFNNWISAIGGVVAVGALFSFALLVWMDFTQGEKNPYLGIFTYIVAPGFLIAGLAIIAFGAWLHRRHARRHAPGMSHFWSIDLDRPRDRRNLVIFGTGATVFFLLSAFGSYQTYHYSESTQFCGQVCHVSMGPEFTAYQRMAHANVACTECHVGAGPGWYLKAKVNGTHQLIAYLTNRFERPIKAPVQNMRPASATCLKCHWLEKFQGNIDITHQHFLSDKKNTPYQVRLLLHVGGGKPANGPFGGIHWHMNIENKVEYYATDEQRQQIPWIRVTPKGEAPRVFRTEDFKGEPPTDKIRVMDCMDCHNRPAHVFPTPNDLVEQAMALGRISINLPGIKRTAVQALTQDSIKTSAEAPVRIADFLRAKYQEAPELPAAIAEVQAIFAVSRFPEMKADWRNYPVNIGHKDSLGCFRCHDDKHTTATGRKVQGSDCQSCHLILGQGKSTHLSSLDPQGLEFAHPGGELDPELTCADCHNGAIQGK